MNKKVEQLGMNPSTASNRLVKDILFKLIVQTGQDDCFHCGKKVSRADFSIEHKTPWLDSDNPQKMFFDLNNIAFSHIKCNVSASRGNIANYAKCGTRSAYQRGCRCRLCMNASMEHSRSTYTPEKRRERYLRNGK